jgi:hypothetical protein
MTNWPTTPLIKVVRGREYDEPVRDALAARTGDDEYLLATGPRAGHSILRKAPSDDIGEWEEVTAVPTAALKRLRDERGRETSLHNLRAAIDDVLECLPAGEPSALDRAVTRVKDIKGAPMVDADSTQEERLSILLDALASVQSATRKTAPLTMVTRICADWANLENPHSDALAEIRSRAEGNPVRADLIVLSSFIGDIATSLDDGMSDGPRGDLIEMGWYALAWAAQTIEEEDK